MTYFSREQLFDYWNKAKSNINTSFIFLHSRNENWGLFSTYFANRTKDMGYCCTETEFKALHEILDDARVLMFLTNQHLNFSHPKVLSLPRGLYLKGENKKVIHDSMRRVLLGPKKSKLMFTATSDWKHRPQITNCVKKRLPSSEFEGYNFGPSDFHKRISLPEYVVYRTNSALAQY